MFSHPYGKHNVGLAKLSKNYRLPLHEHEVNAKIITAIFVPEPGVKK